MVDYNIIKNCAICRKRFVVNKNDSKKMYCEDCEKKVGKDPE